MLLSEGSLPPFFCVHPIGGHVFAYHELARRLGPDQPFYGLQTPSFEDDMAPPSLEDLAEQYWTAVRRVCPRGPYLLGGWSMGAVVAFEMASQLQSEGGEPVVLALFDPPAPATGDHIRRSLDTAALFGAFVRDLTQGRWRPSPHQFEGLGREELVTEILNRAVSEGVLPPGTSPAHLEQLVDTYQTNRRALDGYRPGVRDLKIHLFRAEETAKALGGEEEWRHYATSGCVVHSVPGDHFSFLTPSHVDALADRLRTVLDDESLVRDG